MNMNMDISAVTGWFDGITMYFTSLAPDEMAAWATIGAGLLIFFIGLIVM